MIPKVSWSASRLSVPVSNLPLFDRNSLKLGLMPMVNDLAVSMGKVLVAGFGPLIFESYELYKRFVKAVGGAGAAAAQGRAGGDARVRRLQGLHHQHDGHARAVCACGGDRKAVQRPDPQPFARHGLRLRCVWSVCLVSAWRFRHGRHHSGSAGLAHRLAGSALRTFKRN